MTNSQRDFHTSAKIAVIAWSILIIIPALLYAFSVQLFPRIELDTFIAQAWFAITSSGTVPYGIVTGLVLLIACYYALTRQQFMPLLLTVSLSMAATLSLNHVLKPFFSEPRPYAVLMQQEGLLNLNDFYQASAAEKKTKMTTGLSLLATARPELTLSDSIEQHWQHETGYAFPSGHTLFAVTLALSMGFYLLMAGQTLFPLMLFSWAISMGFSRMLLGMHSPADVLASSCIGGLMSFASIYLIHKVSPSIPFLQKLSATK